MSGCRPSWKELLSPMQLKVRWEADQTGPSGLSRELP